MAMKGLPEGMIVDRDNVVYYDTEKQLFYMIKWRNEGDRDIAYRFYIKLTSETGFNDKQSF